MLSPRPVPLPVGLVVKNGSKIRCRTAGSMPVPSSATSMQTPAGLPSGTSVAHKTGSFQGVYHDAGIVEISDRKPFVLVVLTRGIQDEPKAHKLVAEIARVSFERVKGRR